MRQGFSAQTENGFRLVWMQYDKEKIREGQKLLQMAAAMGDREAYCFLALTYFGAPWVWETALPKDVDKGRFFLQESVRQESCCGTLTASQLESFYGGAGLPPAGGEEAARNAVLEMAENGHPFCQWLMGVDSFWPLLWDGLYDPHDMWSDQNEISYAQEQAVRWYEKALYNGVTWVLQDLEWLYQGNGDIPGDEAKLWKAVSFAAERGDPLRQKRMADLFYEKQLYGESLQWYERAARSGETGTWHHAGRQMLCGQGTAADAQAAAEAFQKGAAAGDAACQCQLGKLYLADEGVSRDPAKAYHWIAKSAEGGSETGMLYLGHCFLYGIGVKQDTGRGANLLLNAASGAQERFLPEDRCRLYLDLGDAYENGLGVHAGEAEAGAYFALAASLDNAEAAVRLAHYQKRRGKWKRVS